MKKFFQLLLFDLYTIANGIIMYFYYNKDNEEINDNYGYIFVYNMSLYISTILLPLLLCFKQEILYNAWFFVLSTVDYILSLMSFTKHVYVIYPTYSFLLFHFHVVSLFFIYIIIGNMISKCKTSKNKEENYELMTEKIIIT